MRIDMACLAAGLIHKPAISEPEKFAIGRHQLYRYASRLLLERVSWLCRDHRKAGAGDGFADIAFSNRAQISYDELRGYPEAQAKDLAAEIEQAYSRFPNFGDNADEQRQLKAEIYKTLLRVVAGKKMIELADRIMSVRED